MKPKASLIFIHGIYHGAWCWENFTKYFEERGFYTDAVTLFDGSSKAKLTLNDYLGTVDQAVQKAKQTQHGPVILVGHSKGGGLAECFIARRPGKVDGVVLLSALPLRRAGRFVVSFVWRHVSSARTMREMIALLLIAVKLSRSKPVPAALLQRCALFSSRIPLADAEHYARLLAHEPLRPSLELGMFAFSGAKGTIPVHTVASTGDHVFSPWEQKMLAGAYGGQTIVLRDICHDMMLDPEWERAAEATSRLVLQIEQQSKRVK